MICVLAVGTEWQWVPPPQASGLHCGKAQLGHPVEGAKVLGFPPALSSFLFAT